MPVHVRTLLDVRQGIKLMVHYSRDRQVSLIVFTTVFLRETYLGSGHREFIRRFFEGD